MSGQEHSFHVGQTVALKRDPSIMVVEGVTDHQVLCSQSVWNPDTKVWEDKREWFHHLDLEHA